MSGHNLRVMLDHGDGVVAIGVPPNSMGERWTIEGGHLWVRLEPEAVAELIADLSRALVAGRSLSVFPYRHVR